MLLVKYDYTCFNKKNDVFMKDFRIHYITIAGGLGNQMLSYSLWYYLKKKKISAELSPIHEGLLDHNGLEINRVFKNTELIGGEKKKIRLCRTLYANINRYINGVMNILGLHWHFDICRNSIIPFIVFPRYKSYTFFPAIKEELHYIFEFPVDKDIRNINLRKEMLECQSVSVHIRRGDYQSKIVWRILLGDICEKQYYNDAINYIMQKFTRPKFYIFSDDIDWVKQNLNFNDATYINWNQGANSFRDMQLMSYCKANIIANSTFSLMAAWLNIHDDCIHIAPSKWTNNNPDLSYKKYIPSNWITIDNSQPFVSVIIDKNIKNADNIIRSISQQTISDYEIILPKEYNLHPKFKDKRIKIGIQATGHHIINIDNENTWNSKDRYCLQKLLIHIL